MFNPASTSQTMKSSNSRKWLVSATLVLFMLVQFASAVHAAEHAFHQEQSYCAALSHVDNNKLLSHQLAGLQLTSFVAGYVATLLPQNVAASTFHSYHSRAPPQITV